MRRTILATLVGMAAAGAAVAADFEFYGRSGDAIELDFGALPGTAGAASFSGLSVGGFSGHTILTSDDLDQGAFASDGRLWVFANPDRDTPGQGDTDPSARGFQGRLEGSVLVDGVAKTFAVTVQPGHTGVGDGAVQQSFERINRAANNPLFVAQQQQRLRYFGYRTEGGGRLGVNGDFGARTDDALRTFQGAFTGGFNTTQASVDGIIGPNTAGWLNAANAPTWDELIDPDPQFPGSFSVGAMIGDFDILPSRDPGTGQRTGLTPQIERFGTSWSIDLFTAGAAAAKQATGITQLMNGMSTSDGYGSACCHGTHRVGMDIDMHVDVSTWNFGNGFVSAAEQDVIDHAIALIDAGRTGDPNRGGVSRIITSNDDILDGIRAARPFVSFYFDDGGGHQNHLHIDVSVPAQVAGAATLAGDFNRDGVVDAGDYTVWRDGLGATLTAADYNAFLASFGAGAAALAVPEPAAAALLLVGAFASAGRRGRRDD